MLNRNYMSMSKGAHSDLLAEKLEEHNYTSSGKIKLDVGHNMLRYVIS